MKLRGVVLIKNPIVQISAMRCTEATFVKKISCLVARIVSYYAVVLHLLTFHILDPYPSKDIGLGLSHVISQ